jgi:hypothetical protein
MKSKRSSLRLTELENPGNYVHVDVVPGRYTDDSHDDVFLYQESGDKGRLKTNPGIHIDHVLASGVPDAIKLLKLWNVRSRLGLKTFILELIVIDVLKGKKEESLPDQILFVFAKLRDEADNITVKDPANPEGNDLSSMLDESLRARLSGMAASALQGIEDQCWQTLFGEVNEDRETRIRGLRGVVAGASVQPKPWTNGK